MTVRITDGAETLLQAAHVVFWDFDGVIKDSVAAKSAVPIDTTGTATYIALTKSTGSVLLYVTTCTSQALTAGGTVDFPAWDIELADPT